MEIDLKGRIANTKLPRSNGLFPLFEAVSNSMQSIEEAGQSDGRIDIEILRDTSQLSLVDGEPLPNQPIIGFEVTDNGIGISKSQIISSNSLGLLGMKERTMLVGGRFQINGVRDQGTNVKVEIPLYDSDQGPEISMIEH